jgi:hypothetical protein
LLGGLTTITAAILGATAAFAIAAIVIATIVGASVAFVIAIVLGTAPFRDRLGIRMISTRGGALRRRQTRRRP